MRKKMGTKLFAIGIVAGLILFLAYGIFEASQLGVHQGYEPDQPIAFSHKIHAGENKIPCMYCHFGAKASRHAGIPPANVCLNCHNEIKTDSPEIEKIHKAVQENKPIQWVKVHNLPDFVYFNHSQHIIAGVQCESCHGAVEKMGRMKQVKSLRMGWCIECHRQQGIKPPKGHGDTAEEELALSEHPNRLFRQGIDCAKCHY